VEVDHQVVFGGGLDDLLVPIDHVLVVAIHEIDFYPGNPPLFIQRKSLRTPDLVSCAGAFVENR